MQADLGSHGCARVGNGRTPGTEANGATYPLADGMRSVQ